MIIASKDNPRLLQHKDGGDTVRCVDQGEYLRATTTRGYRDVTDRQTGTPSTSSTTSTAGGGAQAGGTATPEPPTQSANKDAWVDYAVKHRSADRAAADQMTKPELIVAYGTPPASSSS